MLKQAELDRQNKIDSLKVRDISSGAPSLEDNAVGGQNLIILITVVSTLTLSLLVFAIIHYCLKRNLRTCLCLGARPDEVEGNDGRQNRNRAWQYETGASKWRKNKEKALRKLMKPFKYSKKK